MATPTLDPIRRALAVKAAIDSGWELPPADEAGGLCCGSARFAATALVRPAGERGYSVVFSDARLARELHRSGFIADVAGAFAVEDDRRLDRLMQRASQLALGLPEAPLAEYRRRTQGAAIEGTEVERLVKQRIGQDCFRNALLTLWDNRCAVTDLAVVPLLRASHAKPWAACESDQERLDPFNGLLLAPNLDALFDGGWITFSDAGELSVSGELPAPAARKLLGDVPRRLRWTAAEHLPYLAYHRSRVFRTDVGERHD